MRQRKTKQATATTAKNNRAAIYVRVSGEYDERTASLDSQEEACRKLAEQNGYTVSPEHVFVERHTGKHLHQRKELSKMRELANRREISAICFYEIDRFTRGGSGHIWMLIHEMRQLGIKLLCPNQDLSDTFENNTVITIKAESARRELELLKDRTMRGIRKKLEKGLIPGIGGETFGYRINKETWKREICEPEAEVVKRIYEDIASGKSTNKIASDLNIAGIPSPATSLGRKNKHNTWYRGTINAIVQNEAYRGKQYFNVWGRDEHGDRVKNDPEKIIEMPDVTPPIVSDELWFKANDALRNRLSLAQVRNRTNMNLLRGLVYCLKCGRKMHSKTDGKGYSLFACSSRADEKLLKLGIPNCGASSISMGWLVRWVWYQLRLHLSEPENLKKIVEDLQSGDQQKDLLIRDRERLEKRIEEIEQQSKRIFDQLSRFDDDWLIESCHSKLAELTKQRTAIDGAIQDIDIQVIQLERTRPNVTSLYTLAEQFARAEEDWTDEDRREALLLGGFRIYASGHRFEIRVGSENTIRTWDESFDLVAREGVYDLDLEPVTEYELGSE